MNPHPNHSYSLVVVGVYSSPAIINDSNEDKFIYARYDGKGCANTPTSYSPTIDNDVFLHIVLVKQGTKLRHYLTVALFRIYRQHFKQTSNTADMTIGCHGNLVRFFKGKSTTSGFTTVRSPTRRWQTCLLKNITSPSGYQQFVQRSFHPIKQVPGHSSRCLFLFY